MKKWLLILCILSSCMKSQFDPTCSFCYSPVLPERFTYSYYSFPATDTFFISGIKNDTLSFMYHERESRVFTEKQYLTQDYYWKMYYMAFDANRKIAEKVNIEPNIINSFKLKISIFNQRFKESPSFVWGLYELK